MNKSCFQKSLADFLRSKQLWPESYLSFIRSLFRLSLEPFLSLHILCVRIFLCWHGSKLSFWDLRRAFKSFHSFSTNPLRWKWPVSTIKRLNSSLKTNKNEIFKIDERQVWTKKTFLILERSSLKTSSLNIDFSKTYTRFITYFPSNSFVYICFYITFNFSVQ